MSDNLINAALDATGWSKQDLARRLGVNKSTVQDWTQGRSSPRPGVYVDLKRELEAQRTALDHLITRWPTTAHAPDGRVRCPTLP